MTCISPYKPLKLEIPDSISIDGYDTSLLEIIGNITYLLLYISPDRYDIIDEGQSNVIDNYNNSHLSIQSCRKGFNVTYSNVDNTIYKLIYDIYSYCLQTKSSLICIDYVSPEISDLPDDYSIRNGIITKLTNSTKQINTFTELRIVFQEINRRLY